MKTNNPTIIETIKCFKPFLDRYEKRAHINNLCVNGSDCYITDGRALIRWPNMEEIPDGNYEVTKIDKKSAFMHALSDERNPNIADLFDKNPIQLETSTLTPENTIGVIIHNYMLQCPECSINYRYIELFLKLFDEIGRIELHDGGEGTKRLVLHKGDISMMIMPLRLV